MATLAPATTHQPYRSVTKRSSGRKPIPEPYKKMFVRFFRTKGPKAADEAKVRVIVQAYREATPPTRRSSVAEALFRGIEAQSRLKEAEGGSLSADEVRALINLKSKPGVLERYHHGSLLGWREKQNAVRFPVWQFTPTGMLPGLVDSLQALSRNPNLDDWAKVLFFLSPRESLDGRRPLDLLKAGQRDQVISLAQADAE
jgi:hypothetical protein